MTVEDIPGSSSTELLLWLMGRRRRRHVVGDSMAPTLTAGEEILFDPHAYDLGQPTTGAVVVVQHPFIRDVNLVKRITAITDNGRYHVAGDNPQASTDSRAFGGLAPDKILGRVTSRLPWSRRTTVNEGSPS